MRKAMAGESGRGGPERKGSERIDVALVEQGFFPARERARAAIMAGLVFVDGKRVDKAGVKIPPGAGIEVRGDPIGYVSRGGLKLEKALDTFEIDVTNLVALDVGASTGGFTDCLLQRGARKVYAVDVGYGQLAWKLRQDPRVVCLERTNIRYADRELIPEPIDIATIDTSFISVAKFLPAVGSLLAPGGRMVVLVKPQFEAGRSQVGKKGVVRDPLVHRQVLERLHEFAREHSLEALGLTYSPVLGPEGNIEFLLCLGMGGGPEGPADIAAVVEAAHAQLGR
ncbi:MAG: TlyA family RNA methyltransferase [Firmicutes bacterium]|nr:TlyA family RNA methyltransferase [Bacillota bacterium]